MSNTANPDFSNGLIPAVIQDFYTRNVLMVGFMNEEAYTKTLKENRVTFFSRSRQSLWTKGETSGNYLTVVEHHLDCDRDTLLFLVTPAGPVCHTGAATCFADTNASSSLAFLEEVIARRFDHPNEKSYTSRLFREGINKVAQKVGEEAVELVIEAKDDNESLFLNEAADLMFHYLVLLKAKGYTLDDVAGILKSRHQSG